MKIEIIGTLDGEQLHIETVRDGIMGDISTYVQRTVINLQEDMTVKALKKLGWSEPTNEKPTCETCKYFLWLYNYEHTGKGLCEWGNFVKHKSDSCGYEPKGE